MLVRVFLDSHRYYCPTKIDKDSFPIDEREVVIEVPDELVVRYSKVQLEYEEVQKLLNEEVAKELWVD